MVDLHHHLLPDLDDGPKDLETSVQMALTAAEDGITHIVCTPHASARYSFDPEVIAERLGTLRKALAAASVSITLGTGCDFHLSYENIKDALANPRKYTINATEYLLVELPDYGVPPSLGESYDDLRLAGMTPILTHPERNPTLQRDSSLLKEWIHGGMLVQITANSILGKMGKSAEKMSKQLLDNRWVHFVSTDAHNLGSRAPRMSAARDWVTKRCGEEYARLLCQDNPQAVFHGLPMPPQDEPLNLYDDMKSQRSWWKKLFGTNA